jgi:ankyrin repeat protein
MNVFDAIESHDLNQLRSALSGGADPNAIQGGVPGFTPLHAAIEEIENGGSVEALILLLRHGAAVDGWDAKHDSTPLLMALFRGQRDATEVLLAARADVNVLGGEGDTPLRWCVERGDYDMAATLLRCGATKSIDDAGGPSGMTALGRAASQLDLRMMELLLQMGANPDALDADGWSAERRLPATVQRATDRNAALALLAQFRSNP